MSEPVAARPRLTPIRLVSAALVIAALAIAITFWVGNATGPRASDCLPQPEAASKVDAAATGQLAALNGTGTGRGYADLGFLDKNGRAVKISDFAGKFLLVNFWASWCIPCRAEMPALAALAKQANGPDFMVLPINLDIGAGGLDKARAFLASDKIEGVPLYADPSLKALDRLKDNAVALGLPASLLLDRHACELAVLQGPAKWDSPDGQKVIKALEAAQG